MRRFTPLSLALAAALAASLTGCGSAATPAGDANAPTGGAASPTSSPADPATGTPGTSAATPTTPDTPTSDATTTITSTATTPTASATPGTPAPGTSAAAGAVPLTQNLPRTTVSGAHDLPYLAFAFDRSWTQTIRDTDGLDQWRQASTTCQVTAVNDALHETGSDSAATDKALAATTNAVMKQAPTAKLTAAPSVVVARTGAAPVEFRTRRLDYTGTADGKRWTSYFVARAFVADGVVLLVNVSCPTATATARPDLYRTLVGRGHVASALRG